MAGDLTNNAPLRFKGLVYSETFLLETTYAVHIYKGQPLYIDQSVDTGHAMGFVDAKVIAPTDVALGIAAEEKVLAAAAAETEEIKVYVAPTWVGFKSAVFATTDLGKSVYMSGSGTLSGTASDNPYLGILRKVEDGYCYVELATPAVCSGA